MLLKKCQKKNYSSTCSTLEIGFNLNVHDQIVTNLEDTNLAVLNNFICS